MCVCVCSVSLWGRRGEEGEGTRVEVSESATVWVLVILSAPLPVSLPLRGCGVFTAKVAEVRWFYIVT